MLSAVILFTAFVATDRILIKKRIEFIASETDKYTARHQKIPENIDFISQNKDAQRESLCAFADNAIPGWGYCYYGVFETQYVFVVKGYFSDILYESDIKGFVYNSSKYD